ncbi:MAG: hypothetical protein OMOMHJEC_01594 [Xanthomonadales bacterium]|nr:hypothetical protein [Xanthomonadales bacterium]
MSLFAGLRNTYNKAEAALIVKNLLDEAVKDGVMEPGGESQMASSLVGSVWNALPDVFSGTFGLRPHKVITAASALAHGLENPELAFPSQEALLLSLGRLLNLVQKNDPLFGFNSADRCLLEGISECYTRELRLERLMIARAASEKEAIVSEEEIVSAAVTTATDFMNASLVHVDKDALLRDRSQKAGACVFLLGVMEALLEGHRFSELVANEAGVKALGALGLSENSARSFVSRLPYMTSKTVGLQAKVEGGRSVVAWAAGKDDNASKRLLELLPKWEGYF